MIVEFTVYGIPQTQGSLRALRRGAAGRPMIVSGASADARARLQMWRSAIDLEARKRAVELCDGPVAVTVTFFLPRPKSLAKRFWYPQAKPDVDKLARAVLDAITGTVIRDDALVVTLHTEKRYGDPPRAEILVTTVVDGRVPA